MNDRRRINGPIGGTKPPLFTNVTIRSAERASDRPLRSRHPSSLRKMFLKTGVTPSASGSAYLELENISGDLRATSPLVSLLTSSGLKLTCTVHGPRPLPRSVPFSPTIILSAHIKYAPFATRQRRGYSRDASERDLASHLETALKGVIIGDRWPKSGVEVVITVLEGEDDCWWADDLGSTGTAQWSVMNILSGCITIASAAIADAGIDCVDMVSGGIAALVRDRKDRFSDLRPKIVLDPLPSEHQEILAACVVGYLPRRDEITDIWFKGRLGSFARGEVSAKDPTYEDIADRAVQAAVETYGVIIAATKDTAELRLSTKKIV